jgi:hypothetical protein
MKTSSNLYRLKVLIQEDLSFIKSYHYKFWCPPHINPYGDFLNTLR